MKTYDALEALFTAAPPEPRERGTVRLICVRPSPGVHETPSRVRISVETGLEGDRWATHAPVKPGQQVTLMSARVAEWLADGEQPLHMAGDNLLVDLDLSLAALPVGARVRAGTALLEITPDSHSGCRKFNDRFGVEALQWVNFRGHRYRRLRGVNSRVVEAGEVGVGEPVVVEFRPAEVS